MTESAKDESTDKVIERYLTDDDVIYSATQIFDALSDYTRFQILSALCIEDHSVTDLQEHCHVSQSAISHQLRMLRDRGLVSASRDGQRVVYTLADRHVRDLIAIGLEHASEFGIASDKASRPER